jgi:6,7-dimethyl-8-ribityllumazine synthase
MKIALVSATWHSDLLEGAVSACETVLGQAPHGSLEGDRFVVPGCLEIPLFARKLSDSGRYAAVIAFGLIVDGGIYAHEFVAEAVISGMMRVQLDTGMPVLSCVLTPRQFDESPERLAYFRDHLQMKGREVGTACSNFLAVLQDSRLHGDMR